MTWLILVFTWCHFTVPQENHQKFMLCSFCDWNFSRWSRGQGKWRLPNWDHMLLLLSLETHLCMCTHKYTQFSECFQEVWMPGIPFVLACCQGCSWIWMCSCIQEDLEDNMAGPLTAEKQFFFVMRSNQTHNVTLCNYHWIASRQNRQSHRADSRSAAWIGLFYFVEVIIGDSLLRIFLRGKGIATELLSVICVTEQGWRVRTDIT